MPRGASGRPCRYTGAHRSGAGGGRTGRPFTSLPAFTVSSSLVELRVPSPPSVSYRTPPNPPVRPASLIGRGAYGILAVDGSCVDGGVGYSKCGVRRAGIEWNAVPVRAPPCGGGGPSRWRGTGAGHGQVWQPGGGDHADEWGACQYGRPRVQELDGGHNAGWRGGGVRARYAGRRHQVEWRGFVDGAGEGGPSVAPRSRRDPDPGVLGGEESSDTIAVAASPVQFLRRGLRRLPARRVRRRGRPTRMRPRPAWRWRACRCRPGGRGLHRRRQQRPQRHQAMRGKTPWSKNRLRRYRAGCAPR